MLFLQLGRWVTRSPFCFQQVVPWYRFSFLFPTHLCSGAVCGGGWGGASGSCGNGRAGDWGGRCPCGVQHGGCGGGGEPGPEPASYDRPSSSDRRRSVLYPGPRDALVLLLPVLLRGGWGPDSQAAPCTCPSLAWPLLASPTPPVRPPSDVPMWVSGLFAC